MGARVRRAQRLMFDEPAESLASVALRAGFSDQSHFSRAFLDIVGVSPRAWLHQHR
jgi:AraC family transcriptional regulator